MKTIEEIYDGHMTKEIAQKVLDSAESCILILKVRIHELVEKNTCDPNIDVVANAMTHWEEILKQYKKFLKEKNEN